MGIEVAVIGGGSTYTPELIEGLTKRRDRLPIDALVLQDLDLGRLQVMGGLAQRMLQTMYADPALDTKQALLNHPGGASALVGPRIGDAGPLLDALLEANRKHLPRFFAG